MTLFSFQSVRHAAALLVLFQRFWLFQRFCVLVCQPLFAIKHQMSGLLVQLGMAFLLCLLWLMPAQAHQSSTAYLHIQSDSSSSATTDAQPKQTLAQYRLAIRDLALLVPLDANQDRQISWGEIQAQQPEIMALLSHNIQWQHAGQPCMMNSLQQPLAMDQVAGMAYLVMYLAIDCNAAQPDQLNYQILSGIDSGHRLILTLGGASEDSLSNSQASTGTTTKTWLVASGSTLLQGENTSRFHTIKTYLSEGIHHLLTGYDHLLFLFCLLVTAVYHRQNKQWIPVQSARTAIRHTLYIATAFTVAHSITLTLAVLKIVILPAQWIESIIAFSIALAAINNLLPVFGPQQIRIAFLFGLVHGFGFANVLSELPLDNWSRGLALLSFNLGIELGQISCILIFFPLALVLRRTVFYREIVLQAGSGLACLLALIWMTQRILGLNWIAG